MAIAYAAAGTGVSNSTTAALDPRADSNANSTNILIMHVLYRGTSEAPTTPTGWILLDGPRNVGTTVAGRSWVFGKIAEGVENSESNSLGTTSTAIEKAARIYRFSGRVNGTAPVINRLIPAASFAYVAHATDPQGVSVTTTETGALAVALTMQTDNNVLEAISGMSGGTWTENTTYAPALTTGLCMDVQSCTPTNDPGTVSGGAETVQNDPSATVGFEIRTQPALTNIYARHFDGVDDVIHFGIGSCNLTGAFTIAMLCRNWELHINDSMIVNHTSNNSLAVSFYQADYGGLVAAPGLSVGGSGADAPDYVTHPEMEWGYTHDWVIQVITKATGSATPRYHLYRNGTWRHADGQAALGNPSTQAGGNIRIPSFAGLSFDPLDVAVAAQWNGTALSDGQIETLTTNLQSQDWFDLDPSGLWNFNQASTGTAVDDVTGNGADQTSITGTTVISDGPANWDYTISSPIIKDLTAVTKSDSSQTLNIDKKKTISVVSETDSGQILSVTHVHYRTITSVVESDTAQILKISKYILNSTETDTAQALSISKKKNLTPVIRSDIAQLLGIKTYINLTSATGTDIAQTLKITHLSAAHESDFAVTQISGILNRRFAGNPDRIRCAIGGNNQTGAFTVAILFRSQETVETSQSDLLINNFTSGGALAVGMSRDFNTGIMYLTVGGTSRSGTTQTPGNEWIIFAASKAAGTATPRGHIFRVGQGWVHENLSGTLGNPNSQSGGFIQFAAFAAIIFSKTDIAVAGEWNVELSDNDVESLIAGTGTQAWADLSPTGLWDFNQASIETPVEDLTGNGADQTIVVGTEVNNDGPYWTWDYGIVQNISITSALETDTSQSISRIILKSITPVIETEAVQTLNIRKSKNVVSTTETNSAMPSPYIDGRYARVINSDNASLYARHGEISGLFVADYSGNNNIGIARGNYTLGQSGLIVSDSDTSVHTGPGIPPNDGRIDFPTYFPFVNGVETSFEFWIKLDSGAINGADVFEANNPNDCPQLVIGDPGTNWIVGFTINISTGSFITWTGAWPGTNQTVHCVLTWDDPNNTGELWINGHSLGQRTSAGSYEANPGHFVLGDVVTNGSVALEGIRDETAIYEYILTPAQIAEHYFAGLGLIVSAIETSSAQVLNKDKQVTLVASTESETAQAISFTQEGPQEKTLTFALETDTAQLFNIDKQKTISSASEIDFSQILNIIHIHYRTLTLISEIDTAQDIAYSQTGSYSIISTQESDSGQSLSITHIHYRTLNYASETEVAQELSFTKTIYKTLVPATETDESRILVIVRAEVISSALETDTAQALSITKIIYKTLIFATESELAQILNISKVIYQSITAATETDVARILNVTHIHYKILVHAVETDTAYFLLLGGAENILPAFENDVAQSLKIPKLIPIDETDIAQPISYIKIKSIISAVESDIAQVANYVKIIYKSLISATEIDENLSLNVDKRKIITPVSESDTSISIISNKKTLIIPATESSQSQPINLYRINTISPAQEFDIAGFMGVAGTRIIVPAIEADEALSIITTIGTISIVPGNETDIAMPLLKHVGRFYRRNDWFSGIASRANAILTSRKERATSNRVRRGR